MSQSEEEEDKKKSKGKQEKSESDEPSRITATTVAAIFGGVRQVDIKDLGIFSSSDVGF